MERTTPKPEVGMGVTYGAGSDCYPGTIAAITHGGKTLLVQADRYWRTDTSEYGGQQEYGYAADPDAPMVAYTLRKNGRYYRKGQTSLTYGSLGIGHRRAYRDPHF